MQNLENEMLENEGTYLPMFQGFYSTLYEFDYENELYNYNDDQDGIQIREKFGYNRDIKFDDLEIDYSQYEFDVVKQFIEVLQRKLNSILPNIKIEFEKIVSPKEYNFVNDSVNVSITLPIKPLQDYINSNYEEFTDYIKNKYSSCSGFISVYSHNADDWKNETNNFQEFPNSHYLGSILDFICNREFEDINIYYEVMESIYTGNYITLNKCTDSE